VIHNYSIAYKNNARLTIFNNTDRCIHLIFVRENEMKNKNGLRVWQFGVAIFGTLIWLLIAAVISKVNAFGWTELYNIMSGYFLGTVSAFSGYAFWEVVQGRADKFIDNNIFRWLSILMLFFIFVFGLLSLLTEIFGNTNWLFNIGTSIGGFVVALGLVPTIEKL
jgi:hypothetical protein